MATATLPTVSAAPAATRGFPGLKCPLCAEEDTVNVTLADVAIFHCTSCDEDIDAADARAWAERWLRVLEWTAQAPVIE
jgi:hypothetical protein